MDLERSDALASQDKFEEKLPGKRQLMEFLEEKARENTLPKARFTA